MSKHEHEQDGSTFKFEKFLVTIYAIAFVAVVGISVHSQLTRIMPSGPDAVSLAANELQGPQVP
jgi:hypothetical protein